jgi:hypothetical protein
VCGNCGKGLEKRVNFKKPKHGEVFCSRTCMYEARAKGITPGKVKGTPNSGVKITKEEKLANRRAYRKKKILTDPKYRLINTLRVRLHEYINQRGYKKDRNTFKVIGCTPDELREHIEKQWEPWMNWGNYGKYKPDTYNYGWDVDHFIPTSSAKTKKEIYKLSHYTNLKPLCSRINRHVKKDTIPT